MSQGMVWLKSQTGKTIQFQGNQGRSSLPRKIEIQKQQTYCWSYIVLSIYCWSFKPSPLLILCTLKTICSDAPGISLTYRHDAFTNQRVR